MSAQGSHLAADTQSTKRHEHFTLCGFLLSRNGTNPSCRAAFWNLQAREALHRISEATCPTPSFCRSDLGPRGHGGDPTLGRHTLGSGRLVPFPGFLLLWAEAEISSPREGWGSPENNGLCTF